MSVLPKKGWYSRYSLKCSVMLCNIKLHAGCPVDRWTYFGQPVNRLTYWLTYINAYEISILQVKVDVYMKSLNNMQRLTGQPSS